MGGKVEPLNVGETVIAVDDDQSEPQTTVGRKRGDSIHNTDPNSLAVRDAEQGTWYSVLIQDASFSSAVRKRLRSAGTYHGVRVVIDPNEYGDKVRFKTAPKNTRSRTQNAEPAPDPAEVLASGESE